MLADVWRGFGRRCTLWRMKGGSDAAPTPTPATALGGVRGSAHATVSVVVFVMAFVTVLGASLLTGVAWGNLDPVQPASPSTTYPFTFMDDAGVEVTIAAPPRAMVAFGPGNAEIRFALGLGHRVVGVDHWSARLGEAAGKVDIGTFSEPSFEVLVALQPDLILVTSDHAAQHRAR